MFLAALFCLGTASSAALQQSSTTTYTELAARTVTTAPTPTTAAATSVEYYTSTDLIVLPGETNNVFTRPAQTITIAIPTCHQTAIPDSNGYVPAGSCNAL
jgi:hypothetical protein